MIASHRARGGLPLLSWQPVELKRYPLAQLTLARPEPRRAPDDIGLERLIAQHGIKPPILVTPLSDKLFDVIDGERRVALARDLSARGKLASALHFVPCLVVTIQSPQERALWRLLFNLHHPICSEEREQLFGSVGVAGIGAKPSLALGGGGATPLRTILDLQNGVCDRRGAIRGARRMMEILEVARVYSSGGVSFQEAMDLLRRADAE